VTDHEHRLLRGAVQGFFAYHGARSLSRDGWLLFIGSMVSFTIALYSLRPAWDANGQHQESLTFNSIMFGIGGVILFVLAGIDTWQSVGRRIAAQQAAQQVQLPAPVVPVQRTERTVRVTRTPPPPTPTSAPKPAPRPPALPPSTPPSPTVRSNLIVVTNTHKPVRHAELNSGLRINDRRGFDPEVGE
jgi:hypothetical protein